MYEELKVITNPHQWKTCNPNCYPEDVAVRKAEDVIYVNVITTSIFQRPVRPARIKKPPL